MPPTLSAPGRWQGAVTGIGLDSHGGGPGRLPAMGPRYGCAPVRLARGRPAVFGAERLSREGYTGFALAATNADDVLDERGQNLLAGVPPAYITEDHRDIWI